MTLVRPFSRHSPTGLRLAFLCLVLTLVLCPGQGRAEALAPAAADPIGVWPLSPEPEVVAAFDPPGSAYGPGHRGVDLRGRPGQTVRAALPGTVVFVGTIAGRGVVVVSHGTTRTTYEPVAATVALGRPVAAATVLGRLQAVGSHCLPTSCLHWGWIEGASHYLDPLRLVGGGPVRLLPLGGRPPVGQRWPHPPLLSLVW